MPKVKQSYWELMVDNNATSVLSVKRKQCESDEAFEALWVRAVRDDLLRRVDFVRVAPKQLLRSARFVEAAHAADPHIMAYYSSYRLKVEERGRCDELAMEYDVGLNFMHCPTLVGSVPHVVRAVRHLPHLLRFAELGTSTEILQVLDQVPLAVSYLPSSMLPRSFHKDLMEWAMGRQSRELISRALSTVCYAGCTYGFLFSMLYQAQTVHCWPLSDARDGLFELLGEPYRRLATVVLQSMSAANSVLAEVLKVRTTQGHFERAPNQQTFCHVHLRSNSAGGRFELRVPAEEARSRLLLIKMLAHVPAGERVLHISALFLTPYRAIFPSVEGIEFPALDRPFDISVWNDGIILWQMMHAYWLSIQAQRVLHWRSRLRVLFRRARDPRMARCLLVQTLSFELMDAHVLPQWVKARRAPGFVWRARPCQ